VRGNEQVGPVSKGLEVVPTEDAPKPQSAPPKRRNALVSLESPKVVDAAQHLALLQQDIDQLAGRMGRLEALAGVFKEGDSLAIARATKEGIDRIEHAVSDIQERQQKIDSHLQEVLVLKRALEQVLRDKGKVEALLGLKPNGTSSRTGVN